MEGATPFTDVWLGKFLICELAFNHGSGFPLNEQFQIGFKRGIMRRRICIS